MRPAPIGVGSGAANSHADVPVIAQLQECIESKNWDKASLVLAQTTDASLDTDTLDAAISNSDIPMDVFRKVVVKTRNFSETELLSYVKHIDSEKWKALLNWQPKVVGKVGSWGYEGVDTTLLHELCRRQDGKSFDIIRTALLACPLAAFVSCRRRDLNVVTPLNMLSFTIQSASVVRDLYVDILDDLLRYRSATGATVLHEIISHAYFDSMEDECRAAFRVMVLDVVREAYRRDTNSLMAVDEDRGTLLHFCGTGARGSSIDEAKAEWTQIAMGLLQTCPELATMPDALGRLPLHTFCSQQQVFVPMNVIMRMLELYPDALWQKAVTQETEQRPRTPLQMWSGVAWPSWSGSVDYWAVFAAMASRVGEYTLENPARVDERGRFSLRAKITWGMLDSRLSADCIASARRQFSFAWDVANRNGDLPLQTVVKRRRLSDKFCFFDPYPLLFGLAGEGDNGAFEQATLMTDARGNFALHVALRNADLWYVHADCGKRGEPESHWPPAEKRTENMLRALSLSSVDVLRRRSPSDALRPFEIAARQCHMELCFELLRGCPDVISESGMIKKRASRKIASVTGATSPTERCKRRTCI